MSSLRYITAVAVALVLTVSTAHALTFETLLLGVNEVPPTASPATGFANVDITGDILTVNVTWTGLVGGPAAAAHIHCCTDPAMNVGVAVGFPGFPAALSGMYTHVFNLLDPAIYTASFLTNFGGGTAAGAEAALEAGIEAGQAYVNIHNATFPGGEIRGQLAAVPEPTTLGLLALSVAALFLPRVRTRR